MEFKLIIKKLTDSLTEEEEIIIKAWMAESNTHKAYFEKVRKNYLEGSDVVDIQKGWANVSSKSIPRKREGNYWKYAAAVAAIIVLGTILFVFEEKNRELETTPLPIVKSDPIHIGADKATLTLEDGSKVVLEKGESYENDKITSNGEKLTYKSQTNGKEETVTYNILTVPRGGQFFLALADGTKVWLNSDSKLRYPVAFAANCIREVELLYGEAYFEVSRSADHNGTHFIVATQEQKVDVLGTEFNIKAYREDAVIATTLVEGKVLVEKGSVSKNLSPGQQSKLNIKTHELNVVAVDVYNEISWKDGFFSFKDKNLEDIMRVLSRWYDIEIVFKNDAVKELTFNGVFRKNQNLDEILMSIQKTEEVTYSTNEKTITME